MSTCSALIKWLITKCLIIIQNTLITKLKEHKIRPLLSIYIRQKACYIFVNLPTQTSIIKYPNWVCFV